MQQLTLPLNATDLYIRRSPRAKRLRVSVTPVGKIEVVVPRAVTLHDAQRFIQAQKSWIDRKRQQIATLRPTELNELLPANVKLPAINEQWKVEYREGAPSLTVEKKHVTNTGVLHLTIEHESKAESLLKHWLTEKAKSTLLPWLDQTSEQTGLTFSAVSVRGQKTRWASCSAKRNISLNRCMLFLKPEQVHYLLVHELCHTREMNHSKKFWKLVSRFVPDYVEQEKSVNEYCYKLPRWAY